MDQKGRELGILWNNFIRNLIKAQNTWEVFQKKLLFIAPDEIEVLPVELQKAIVRHKKASFTVMLPRFVDYWRAYHGNLESLLIELSKKEEKKEE